MNLRTTPPHQAQPDATRAEGQGTVVPAGQGHTESLVLRQVVPYEGGAIKESFLNSEPRTRYGGPEASELLHQLTDGRWAQMSQDEVLDLAATSVDPHAKFLGILGALQRVLEGRGLMGAEDVRSILNRTRQDLGQAAVRPAWALAGNVTPNAVSCSWVEGGPHWRGAGTMDGIFIPERPGSNHLLRLSDALVETVVLGHAESAWVLKEHLDEIAEGFERFFADGSCADRVFALLQEVVDRTEPYWMRVRRAQEEAEDPTGEKRRAAAEDSQREDAEIKATRHIRATDLQGFPEAVQVLKAAQEDGRTMRQSATEALAKAYGLMGRLSAILAERPVQANYPEGIRLQIAAELLSLPVVEATLGGVQARMKDLAAAQRDRARKDEAAGARIRNLIGAAESLANWAEGILPSVGSPTNRREITAQVASVRQAMAEAQGVFQSSNPTPLKVEVEQAYHSSAPKPHSGWAANTEDPDLTTYTPVPENGDWNKVAVYALAASGDPAAYHFDTEDPATAVEPVDPGLVTFITVVGGHFATYRGPDWGKAMTYGEEAYRQRTRDERIGSNPDLAMPEDLTVAGRLAWKIVATWAVDKGEAFTGGCKAFRPPFLDSRAVLEVVHDGGCLSRYTGGPWVEETQAALRRHGLYVEQITTVESRVYPISR